MSDVSEGELGQLASVISTSDMRKIAVNKMDIKSHELCNIETEARGNTWKINHDIFTIWRNKTQGDRRQVKTFNNYWELTLTSK